MLQDIGQTAMQGKPETRGTIGQSFKTSFARHRVAQQCKESLETHGAIGQSLKIAISGKR